MLNEKQRDILNKEFDEQRLQVKWALEDLYHSFDKYHGIFTDESKFEEIAKFLSDSIHKISNI